MSILQLVFGLGLLCICWIALGLPCCGDCEFRLLWGWFMVGYSVALVVLGC